jgi:hypothetical protein
MRTTGWRTEGLLGWRGRSRVVGGWRELEKEGEEEGEVGEEGEQRGGRVSSRTVGLVVEGEEEGEMGEEQLADHMTS